MALSISESLVGDLVLLVALVQLFRCVFGINNLLVVTKLFALLHTGIHQANVLVDVKAVRGILRLGPNPIARVV